MKFNWIWYILYGIGVAGYNKEKYTINAVVGEKTGSATLIVTKETLRPSRIEGNEPGGDFDTNLEIPADNAADKTVQFSINVWDQYGELMSDPDVIWSLCPNNVDGVSLSNDGMLTISNDAKGEITDTTGTKFTISATCGDLGPATTEVTVKRADPVATSIAIYKDGSESPMTSDTIAIPQNGSTNVTYTAKVLDQYGSEMAGAVAWSTEGTVPSNVTATNGTVTVPAGASTGRFSLKATSDSVSGSVSISVASISFGDDETIKSALTISDTPTYGMTWGDIVKVTGEISANVGGTPVEGTYSVKDADTTPDAGENEEYTILFTSTDGTYNKYYRLHRQRNYCPEGCCRYWNNR